MVQSQKKKNKTNKETRLFDLEIGAGPSVPAASGPFDESLATDPDCPAKSPSRKNKENNQWPKRIKKLFESHEKQAVNPQQGYWDPYTKYDTNERVQRFFNGFEMPMGQDKLVYRERFASWAIGEALKDYDSGQFQLTGEVMHNESVTYKADKDRKSLPKEVVDAIRADGQQDIDAEVGDRFLFSLHTSFMAADSAYDRTPTQ